MLDKETIAWLEASLKDRPTSLPYDAPSMRLYLSDGFDRLLGLPRVLLGAQDRTVIYAQQSLWQSAPDSLVLDLLNRIPRNEKEPAMATQPKADPKTWNPEFLGKLLADLYAAAPAVYAAVAPLISDLIGLLSGKPVVQGKQLAAGCCDCGECIDCAIACQVNALACTVQAKCCCPEQPQAKP